MKNKDFYNLNDLGFCSKTSNGKVSDFMVHDRSGKTIYRKHSVYGFYAFEVLEHFTNWLNTEHSILDEKEKEYLQAVIKPFRDKVSYIKKYRVHNQEYLIIKTDWGDQADLPNFEKNTMYRGMEPEREYTLEDLGL